MGSISTEIPNLATSGLPNCETSDSTDSKQVSPTDSENAEKNIAALDTGMNGTVSLSTDTVAKDSLAHDSVVSATTTWAPALDDNSDPLSATALISPLHKLNQYTTTSPQTSGLNGLASLPNVTSNTDSWESFKRVGPSYPPSLEKIIMDYHHRHSKSWQLAHDMGAGSGVYSPTLAKYFRHVHVSDPNPSALATSRKALSAWAALNKKSRGRFTFSTSKPERSHESMADGSVDMAIVMQGAHFTDATAMVLSAAESLSTHGTLALVSYSPICKVTGNSRADVAVQQLFAAWGAHPWDVVCGDRNGKQQFSLGLDFVPLPESLFMQDKTRRITINTQRGDSASFDVPGITRAISSSRVHNAERKHDYNADDEHAKGWRQEVGPEFFRSMTTALMGSTQAQTFESHFKEIENIVHETSPNGIMIDVEWTAAVVLATRK